MIAACMVAILVNGFHEDHYLTGDVKAVIGNTYVVDFSNAVSEIKGAEGNYSNYIIENNECVIKGWKKK